MRIRTLALFIVMATPAGAQNGDWTYSITPYAWLPGTTTSVTTDRGTITAKADGSDALSDLDFAFMGTFAARNGRWGLIADLLYSDFSKDIETPLGLLYSSGTVATEISALSGYVAYRVYESAGVDADVLGGFRAYSAGIDLTLRPGVLPGRDDSFDESWIDLLVGGRVGARFDERWSGALAVDVGGFDRHQDFTWQALATLNYDINPHWTVRGGWRHLVIEKEFDAVDVDVKLSGPVLGVQYKF